MKPQEELIIPSLGHKYHVRRKFLGPDYADLKGCSEKCVFECKQVANRTVTRIKDMFIKHPKYYLVCKKHKMFAEVPIIYILSEVTDES